MTQDQPPKLDYAEPELPRPGLPPDGYLGYRSDEPPEGTRVGCIGWIVILAVTVLIIYGALWLLGRKLVSHGV